MPKVTICNTGSNVGELFYVMPKVTTCNTGSNVGELFLCNA